MAFGNCGMLLFFFLCFGGFHLLYYSLYVVFCRSLAICIRWFSMNCNSFWRMVFKPFTFITIIAVFLSGKYSEVFFENKKNTVERFTFCLICLCVTLYIISFVILFPSLLLLCYILVNVLTLVFLVLIVYSIIYLYYKRNR
jgi:Na+/alanine symporter